MRHGRAHETDPVRSLLFVSPVVPSPTGSGLAMRACTMLELLARRHAVWLYAVPLHGRIDAQVPDSVAAHCRGVGIAPANAGVRRASPLHHALGVQLPKAGSPRQAASFAGPFRDVAFDVVHVHRLTALPHALPYLSVRGSAPATHVDLDEVESVALRRFAHVCRGEGREMAARFADVEAARCAAFERELLEHADRVYVSSPAERDALAHAGHQAKVRVVPNVVALPRRSIGAPAGDPFRLLFVGTLGFPANEDAVVHFCRDILPCLRRIAPRAIEFTIVGAGATPRIEALAAADDVRLVGAVPDVTPYYEETDVVVVPLRAGGGTRLKVLEAMAHGRPVVSTSTGVDGIEIVDGHHALIAGTAEAFAGHCRRLMTDAALGARLAGHALAMVRSAHSAAAATEALYAS